MPVRPCGSWRVPVVWGLSPSRVEGSRVRFQKGVFQRRADNFRYQYDLMMDVMSGHISKGDTGPVLGSVYVNKLIER